MEFEGKIVFSNISVRAYLVYEIKFHTIDELIENLRHINKFGIDHLLLSNGVDYDVNMLRFKIHDVVLHTDILIAKEVLKRTIFDILECKIEDKDGKLEEVLVNLFWS